MDNEKRQALSKYRMEQKKELSAVQWLFCFNRFKRVLKFIRDIHR